MLSLDLIFISSFFFPCLNLIIWYCESFWEVDRHGPICLPEEISAVVCGILYFGGLVCDAGTLCDIEQIFVMGWCQLLGLVGLQH